MSTLDEQTQKVLQEKKDVTEQDKHDKPDVAEVVEVEYTYK